MQVYLGWLEVGGHFLWVSGDTCKQVEVYLGWVGVNEHYLWASWGGWRYILGEWEWVDIFYG